jgi:broad specificity phosphatase PhoE
MNSIDSNYTTVYLTRHAKSTRNYYDQHNIDFLKIPDDVFLDTSLCPEGIESVIMKRKLLRNKIGPVDIIFTSPMKRCLQTTLLTFEDIVQQRIPGIYVMPLLTEIGTSTDCIGKHRKEIIQDPDIFEYKHYPALNFKKYFNEGIPNTENWINPSFLLNTQRTQQFLKFVQTHFFGKTIHVFTHSGFIYHLLGKIVDNYETICIKIDANHQIQWKLIN